MPDRLPAPGAGGRVLYFYKPADSLVPTPNPDTGPDTPVVAAGASDGPPATPPAVSETRLVAPSIPSVSPAPNIPPVPARPPAGESTAPGYVPAPLPATPPPGYPTATRTPNIPPTPSTSQKPRQEGPTKPAEADPKKRAEWTRLPPRQAIFQMYNDEQLEKLIVKLVEADIEKMRKEQQKPGEAPPVGLAILEPLRFPDLKEIRDKLAPPGTPYVAKTASYPPNKAIYEPNFVIHRRLHFEEKNAERYGWDFGAVQPLISTLYFYKDTLLWPNSLGSGVVTGFWDTSAGKCLPGSPVPYLLYPPGLTSTGMLFEGGIITGTAFILAPANTLPASTAALLRR
jgi:hypothetical protein